jgi:hypothetical protein
MGSTDGRKLMAGKTSRNYLNRTKASREVMGLRWTLGFSKDPEEKAKAKAKLIELGELKPDDTEEK